MDTSSCRQLHHTVDTLLCLVPLSHSLLPSLFRRLYKFESDFRRAIFKRNIETTGADFQDFAAFFEFCFFNSPLLRGCQTSLPLASPPSHTHGRTHTHNHSLARRALPLTCSLLPLSSLVTPPFQPEASSPYSLLVFLLSSLSPLLPPSIRFASSS